MSDQEIIDEIKKYKAQQIVLTGGEPSLFIDEDFIGRLKEETGLRIAIETNGTVVLPENIDWVTVSPKTGMDIQGKGELRVKHADELKVVDVGQDLSPYFEMACVDKNTVMVLQPCFVADPKECMANIQTTIGRVLNDSRWRLSLQTHKFVGIR